MMVDDLYVGEKGTYNTLTLNPSDLGSVRRAPRKKDGSFDLRTRWGRRAKALLDAKIEARIQAKARQEEAAKVRASALREAEKAARRRHYEQVERAKREARRKILPPFSVKRDEDEWGDDIWAIFDGASKFVAQCERETDALLIARLLTKEHSNG